MTRRPAVDLFESHHVGCLHYPDPRMLLEVHPDRDELYALVDAPLSYVIAWSEPNTRGWFLALWPIPDPHGAAAMQ